MNYDLIGAASLRSSASKTFSENVVGRTRAHFQSRRYRARAVICSNNYSARTTDQRRRARRAKRISCADEGAPLELKIQMPTRLGRRDDAWRAKESIH